MTKEEKIVELNKLIEEFEIVAKKINKIAHLQDLNSLINKWDYYHELRAIYTQIQLIISIPIPKHPLDGLPYLN